MTLGLAFGRVLGTAGCQSPDLCLLRWAFAVAKAAVCFLTGLGCGT